MSERKVSRVAVMDAKAPSYHSSMRMEPCSLCGGPRAFVDGTALRVMRQRRGVSLRKLGSALGLTASYLCDLELNRRHCSLKLAARIMSALDKA